MHGKRQRKEKILKLSKDLRFFLRWDIRRKKLFLKSFFLSHCLFFSFFWNACSSLEPSLRVKIPDTSLSDIQNAVLRSLPFGKRRIYSSGRKFHSKYFLIQGEEFLKIQEESPPFRYFAEVLILGFHRPYSLDISIYKEQRLSDSGGKRWVNSSNYEIVGKEEKQAKIVLERIQKQILSLRRKSRSFMEEFRAF